MTLQYLYSYLIIVLNESFYAKLISRIKFQIVSVHSVCNLKRYMYRKEKEAVIYFSKKNLKNFCVDIHACKKDNHRTHLKYLF